MYRLALTLIALAFWAMGTVPNARAAQDGVIVYGTDYQVFHTGRGGWQQCENTCQSDGRCQAWLFVKTTGQCRLKETAGPTLHNPCCVSDVRSSRPQGRPSHGGGPQQDTPRRITTINYNSAVDGRGPCIQTEPRIPGRLGGWACLWKDNDLYDEMSALILDAYRAGDRCVIGWLAPWQAPGSPGDGARISSIECTPNAP